MRLKIFVVCLFCLSAWKVPPAAADEMYSYVGEPLGGLCLSFPPTPCTLRGKNVSGSFTTSLDPFHLQSLTNFAIPANDIVSFSFTDGNLVSVDQSNATQSQFMISTDSFGHISGQDIFGPRDWRVFLLGSTGEMVTSGKQDWSQPFDAQGNPIDAGYAQSSFESPGVWIDSPVDSPAPTPEPSTFILFGSGLLGILAMGRRSLKTRN